jgi:starch phosphorylase
MKAAINGVLNFSVLDGWWREGFNGQNGWAIGRDMEYANAEEQDAEDAQSLYDTLEKKIVPLYYERNQHKIPVEWLKLVREDLRTLVPQFSLRRMLKEYTNDFYLPAMRKDADR